MKSLVIILALTITATSASAFSPDDFDMEIFSWCDQNNLMTADPQGRIYVKQNCSETNTTCRVYNFRRLSRTLVAAACEMKKN